MVALPRDLALVEIFRAQAADTKRELKFYQESERTLVQHDIREEREKEERVSLDRLEEAGREQIAAFRDRLDRYDTAVVEALMDNEHALEGVRKRREAIEEKAYRLPDGRMAFKSDDGRRVVDQGGKDVSPSVVRPEAIPNDLPREGAYLDARSEEHRLEQEREQLHQFQHKLDDARDTINKGGVSKKELDALGADLDKSIPDAVRHKMDPKAAGRENAGPQATEPGLPGNLSGQTDIQRRRDSQSFAPR